MKLENEISQKRFRGPYHKLAINILYTGSWLESHFAAKLIEYDLTPPQYNVLRILRGMHPECASVTVLKERLLDKMSDASRLVDRLEAKGLALRQKCRVDRRRSDVMITGEGLELLSRLDALDRESDELFAIITEEEAETVSGILDRLRDGPTGEISIAADEVSIPTGEE